MKIQNTIILYLVLLCPILHAQEGFYPTWIDAGGVDYTPGDEVVMKSTSASGWSAGARSAEVLASADDGWIEYEVSAIVTGFRAFGFSSSDPNYHYTSMDYSYRFSTSTVYFQRGSSIMGTLPIVAGDVLRIEKSGMDILYKVNGVTRLTYTAPSHADMFVDLGFNTRWAYIDRLRCSFGETYDATWTNRVGVSVSGGVVTKTDVDGWGNSGLSSENVIKPTEQGWVAYTPSSTTGHLSFGLAFEDADQKYVTMDYALVLNSTGGLLGYKNGSLLFSSTYSAGDELRIEKIGKEIRYLQNGTELSSQENYKALPMVADVSIYRNGTSFNNTEFRLSFDEEIYTFAKVISLDYDTTATVNLSSYGGTQGNRFYWGDSIPTLVGWQAELASMDSISKSYLETIPFDSLFFSSDVSRSFSETGKYRLISKDSVLGDATIPVYVDFAQKLDTSFGMTFSDKVLTKTAATSSSPNARYLLGNGIVTGSSEGSFCIKPVDGLQADFRYGLTVDGTSPATSGAHIKYGFSVSNGSFKTIYNGALGSYLGKVFGNEELMMEATLDSVFYYKNGELILSNSLASGEYLKMDTYLNKQNGKIEVCWIDLDRPRKPINQDLIIVQHWSCDLTQQGNIFVPSPFVLIGCSISFQLLDENLQSFESNFSGIFYNVPPGEYTLKVVPDSGCGLSEWSYSISVGFETEWNTFGNPNLSLYNSVSSSVINTGSFDQNANAKSKNIISDLEAGWFSLKPAESSSSIVISVKNGVNQELIRVNVISGSNTVVYFSDPPYNQNIAFASFDDESDIRFVKTDTDLEFYVSNSLKSSLPLELGQLNVSLAPISPGSGIVNSSSSSSCNNDKLRYAELTEMLDAGFYLVKDGVLGFRYYENHHDVDGELTYRIVDPSDFQAEIINSEVSDAVQTSFHGENKYSLNLSDIDFEWQSGFYILEIQSQKKRKFYLKFRIA